MLKIPYRTLFAVLFVGLLHTSSAEENFEAVLRGLVYDPTLEYAANTAVIISLSDTAIYTSTKVVPAAVDGSNGPNGANKATYWGDYDTTTNQLIADNPTFFDELPTDLNMTEFSKQVADLVNPLLADNSKFYGLAIRAYVGQFPVAGGITISGSESKKVMIRVKGPSMTFSGAKLNDPKISITKQNSAGDWETFLNSDNFGDHPSATSYSSYSTGNTKEPVVVVDMEPGTYGVRVEDAGGAQGNANVEFYEVE